jgi:hypothetical protein
MSTKASHITGSRRTLVRRAPTMTVRGFKDFLRGFRAFIALDNRVRSFVRAW